MKWGKKQRQLIRTCGDMIVKDSTSASKKKDYTLKIAELKSWSMHWVRVSRRPISFPDALFAGRLSLPCNTQRTSLEQEDKTTSKAADWQTSRDPKQGREEAGCAVCGWRLWVGFAIDSWWFLWYRISDCKSCSNKEKVHLRGRWSQRSSLWWQWQW